MPLVNERIDPDRDDHDGATGYAPLGGPPPKTACSFCGHRYADDPTRGWVIAAEAAMCPRCLRTFHSRLFGAEDS